MNKNRYCTIEGFEKLTAQEVFNISALHLMEQGKISNSAQGCAYRTDDGLMCAAGPFLREEAVERCEGMGWGVLVDEYLAPDTNQDLIQALQFVHDSMECDVDLNDPAILRERWSGALTRLAHSYGLTMPEVPAYK